MKNGFTLVELLAVVVILSILSLIVVFSVGPTIDSSKSSLSSIQIKQVEDAARMYYLQEGMNYINYDKDSTKLCISVDYLVDNGYFEEGEVLNLETNEQIGGSVLITYNSNRYTYEYQESNCYLNEYIMDLYNPNSTVENNDITYSIDTANKLIDDRKGGTIESGGNIRYYGSTPNNYIDIGDRDADGNVILWRIIGLFKDITVVNGEESTSTQNLVKIIRDNNLTDGITSTFSWDFESDGSYDNNWTNSTLMTMLNSDTGYYGSGSSYSYYNWVSGQEPTVTTLNLSSAGLSSDVRTKVAKVRWSLGGHNDASVYIDEMYRYERAGTSIWDGRIGLMYPSDYGYAADLNGCTSQLGGYNTIGCYDADWLSNSISQWLLISCSSDDELVWSIYMNIVEVDGLVASNRNEVNPVLYLNSNVEYLTGSGSLDDPIVVR